MADLLVECRRKKRFVNQRQHPSSKLSLPAVKNTIHFRPKSLNPLATSHDSILPDFPEFIGARVPQPV